MRSPRLPRPGARRVLQLEDAGAEVRHACAATYTSEGYTSAVGMQAAWLGSMHFGALQGGLLCRIMLMMMMLLLLLLLLVLSSCWS